MQLESPADLLRKGKFINGFAQRYLLTNNLTYE